MLQILIPVAGIGFSASTRMVTAESTTLPEKDLAQLTELQPESGWDSQTQIPSSWSFTDATTGVASILSISTLTEAATMPGTARRGIQTMASRVLAPS